MQDEFAQALYDKLRAAIVKATSEMGKPLFEVSPVFTVDLADQAECTCDSKTLFARGCVCGYLTRRTDK